MNGMCSLDAMNRNIHFIGLIMLICIVVIVAIYYFRDVNNKHNKIIENYELDEQMSHISNVGYGYNHNGNYNTEDLLKYSNRNIKLRDCQVYFTDENVCDSDTRENKGPCKYVFKDGWKEIEQISYLEGDTPPNTIKKKLYNQNYTRGEADIPNHKEMTTCFKKIDNADDNRYLYNTSDLVKFGYGGLGEKINLKVDNQEGTYISMFFDNTDNSNTNHDSALDTICSLKRDTIASLRKFGKSNENPLFYKFGLDLQNNVAKIVVVNFKTNLGTTKPSQGREIRSNILDNYLKTKGKRFVLEEFMQIYISSTITIAWPPIEEYDFTLAPDGNYYTISYEDALDITLVELNLEQNKFISRGLADFVQSSVIGMEYLDTTDKKINFNVFKKTDLPDMDVELFQFKYNYLCNNNVLEYANQIKTKISITKFLIQDDKPQYGKKAWSIKKYPNINSGFWDNYRINDPREDQKCKIVCGLTNDMESKIIEIQNLYKGSGSNFDKFTNDKKLWLELKNTAEDAKNNFYNKTFFDLMSITKPSFQDINGVNSTNHTTKPFDYQSGYYILKEDVEGPYIPSFKYDGKKSLNDTYFTYTSGTVRTLGNPGLQGTKANSYQRGDRGSILTKAKTYGFGMINGIQNFNGMAQLTKGTNQQPLVSYHRRGRSRQFVPPSSQNANSQNFYSWYWSGYFYAHEEGVYMFATKSDDESFVWLDDVNVVWNGERHPMREKKSIDPSTLSPGYNIQSLPTYFKKGQAKRIEITFSEFAGGDDIQFYWKLPSTSVLHKKNNWVYNAYLEGGKGYRSKTYIFDSASSSSIVNTVKAPTWTFNNGAYYAEFVSDTGDISLDSLKLNGKSFVKGTASTIDEWQSITFISIEDDNEKYDYYIQGRSNQSKIFLKAVDKYNSLVTNTQTVIGGNEPFINTFLDKEKWWDRDVGSDNIGDILPYKVAIITITSYIYLQKGFYNFNTSMNFPAALQITNSVIKFDGITKAGNTEYFNVTSGKFWRMSFSAYVLNNSSISVKPIFSLKADFKSLDYSVEFTDIDMIPYIYGGKKLYTDDILDSRTKFFSIFEDIKVFESNTDANFKGMKEFLTIQGRGNDFWNLTLISTKITELDTEIKNIDNIVFKKISEVENDYILTVNDINSLDYVKEFMSNYDYFDSPEIKYKDEINISEIFSNMGNYDPISSYLTYEKEEYKKNRTSNAVDINYDMVNYNKRSVYLLKSNI